METPDIVHGRLLESAHISGYTFKRASKKFKSLLENDEWKEVSPGFDDIDKYIATIDFSEFKMAIEERKEISKLLAEKRATQRAAARLLGVGVGTINRDIESVPSGTKTEPRSTTEAGDKDSVPNGTKPDNSQFRTSFTGDNEWYTPDKYIEAAREVMGDIDLDPATSEFGQNRIKAKKYYTIENSGLDEEWQGRVWLNPPYSQPDISLFIKKISSEYKAGNVKEAIILTHNHTDTGWFHRAARRAAKICFTKGRINYESQSGEIAHPTQGAAFFYYGPNTEEFISVFKQFGFIR